MVGFISGAPVDSLAEQAAGTDILPTTSGRVLGATFGQQLSDNPFARLVRDTPSEGILGTDEASGITPPAPTLSPEEATAKYGMPGLKFDRPVTEDMAQSLREVHHNDQLRSDILARSDGSLLASAPARIAVSLAAGLLDPMNIAAGLVPVIGEARGAALIARATSAVSRAGVRAGIGAAEGAAGMTLLEPLNYSLDHAESNDWTMGEAVRNIAMGSVFGSVLHVGGGILKDTVTGRTVPRDTARGALLERLDTLDPEAREAALKGSVAAVAEGRPVEVAPLVDLAEARGAVVRDAERAAPEEHPAGEVIGKGDLWRLEPDQLESMLADAKMGDHEKLVRALGSEEEAKEFNRLDRKQNSSDPSRADAGAAEFDQKYGNLTPEQERLIYGTGETTPAAEDIQHVLDSHGHREDSPEHAAYNAAIAMRRASPDDVLSVPEGGGSAAAQAAYVRLRNAYEDMRAAGVQGDDIGRRIVGSLVSVGGWNPEAAAEIVGGFLDRMRARAEGGAAPRVDPVRAIEQLRDNATAPPVDTADLTAARTNAGTLARAPKAEGPVDAQTAELAKLYDAARAMVDREVAAGRLTEADTASLKAADERATQMEGDAKAYEAAAACLATRA